MDGRTEPLPELLSELKTVADPDPELDNNLAEKKILNLPEINTF